MAVENIAYISKCEFTVDLHDSNKSNLLVDFLCQKRPSEGSWPNQSLPFYSMSIFFSDVRNIELNFSGGGNQQITGFCITDVSKNQWDGINFEVEDYENGKISFYCTGYEVKPAIEFK